LEDCFTGALGPLMGDALYYEYESLLYREELFENCALNTREREDFLNDFFSICRWVSVHYSWRPNLRDEGDNHIVELALAGGAGTVLTWNARDFRGGDLVMRDLSIVSPVDYVSERRRSWQR